MDHIPWEHAWGEWGREISQSCICHSSGSPGRYPAGCSDAIKPEALVAVHALHSMGLRVLLLSGDNRRTAQAIAEEVSVRELLCQCES